LLSIGSSGEIEVVEEISFACESEFWARGREGRKGNAKKTMMVIIQRNKMSSMREKPRVFFMN
jgi:hypothetical protein